MKTLLALCCLTAGGMFYTLSPGAAVSENLHGKWKILTPPKDWKIAPGTSINVAGDDIQVRIGPITGSTFHYSADYASGNIDAQKNGEKPRLGKFKLSGQTVTIAVGAPGAPRPASANASGSGVTKWVLKRAPHQ